MVRTIIYVDGFNFYYGAIKNTAYKWLDIKSVFQKLLSSNHHISGIKFFTAPVSGLYNPLKPVKQMNYLNALKYHIPELNIVWGHFLTHTISMRSADPSVTKKYVKVYKTEEKGSDVNLAVHLLNDGWLNSYDCAIVVSNDSDLSEAMRLVKKHHPDKMIGLIMPGKGHPSKQLMANSDFLKRIRQGVLKTSQLPIQIPRTNFIKPSDW